MRNCICARSARLEGITRNGQPVFEMGTVGRVGTAGAGVAFRVVESCMSATSLNLLEPTNHSQTLYLCTVNNGCLASGSGQQIQQLSQQPGDRDERIPECLERVEDVHVEIETKKGVALCAALESRWANSRLAM